MTRVDGLTFRQLEVARLVADCLTVKQVATTLGISARAVHRHIETIAYRWQLDPTKDTLAQIVKRLARRPAA